MAAPRTPPRIWLPHSAAQRCGVMDCDTARPSDTAGFSLPPDTLAVM